MADEIEAYIEWATSQGWEVAPDASGYRRFYTPNGTYVTRYPASPGRPERRFTEVRLACKAHGLVWPPPSKKIQRSMRRKESS